jgi:peptidoglycan L-alanyl-D-glutamate endopeptidase CwlK
MAFSFGARSRAELAGVHPTLVLVCERAIAASPVDFAVHDGLRTIEQQREYVRTGVSKTLASKHLVQADGFGHAVDLVPYINGKLRWEPAPLYEIAVVIRAAAMHEGLELTWGAVWDRQLDELGVEGNYSDARKLEIEVGLYVERRRRWGKQAFLDMPHFEVW